MMNFVLLSAIFMAMFMMVVYAEDTPILPIPKTCPKKDPVNHTVNIAHESNCTLFYACLRGEKILQKCPLMNNKGDRLFFNPLLQVCDWPQNVKCKNKVTSSSEEQEEEQQFYTEGSF